MRPPECHGAPTNIRDIEDGPVLAWLVERLEVGMSCEVGALFIPLDMR
ncbi:hypothetical protein [Deinococcus hopiensis]|nr:hypothetical protein [Deinococcus hopiensis]